MLLKFQDIHYDVDLYLKVTQYTIYSRAKRNNYCIKLYDRNQTIGLSHDYEMIFLNNYDYYMTRSCDRYDWVLILGIQSIKVEHIINTVNIIEGRIVI